MVGIVSLKHHFLKRSPFNKEKSKRKVIMIAKIEKQTSHALQKEKMKTEIASDWRLSKQILCLYVYDEIITPCPQGSLQRNRAQSTKTAESSTKQKNKWNSICSVAHAQEVVKESVEGYMNSFKWCRWKCYIKTNKLVCEKNSLCFLQLF